MTTIMRTALRPIARRPVVHFVLIGAVLFTGWGTTRPAVGGASRTPVVVSADRIALLRSDFEQRWGRSPSPAQLRASVDRAVEDEILYREARVLALDYRDRSVRRRLIEKGRAVTRRPVAHVEELYEEALALGLDDDEVLRRLLAEKMRLILQRDGGAPPSDAALLDYMERHRARFVQPETLTLTQVFFSESTRRDRLAADAAAASVAVAGQPPSPGVVALSDPFPIGTELRAYTPRQLLARFGKPFADRVLALPSGTWSPPLASPYGLHLVWVHEHHPERLPPLDEVRETIELALMQERAAQNLQTGLARLRTLYDVRIEGAL